MTRWVCLAVFCSVTLGADHPIPASTSFDPVGKLGHHVNIVSGDYVDSPVDLVVRGVEPIIVQRAHISSYAPAGFGGRWLVNEERLHVWIGKKRKYAKFWLTESDGTTIVLTPASAWGFHQEYAPMSWELIPVARESVSNQASRADIGNYRFRFNTQTFRWTVTTGNGEKREYIRLSDVSQKEHDRVCHGKNKKPVYECFALKCVHLPNGNRRIYDYSGGKLRSIRTTDATETNTLAWVRFDPQEGENAWVVTTSDGQELVYHYSHQAVESIVDEQGTIEEVSYPGGVTHRYNFGYGSAPVPLAIIGTEGPEHRMLQVDYWDGRVERLRAPTGSGFNSVTTHQFKYKPSWHQTQVTDALGHQWEYHYNGNGHIDKVTFNDEAVGFEEKRTWGHGDQPWRITGKTLWSPLHHYSQTFAYDSKGNLTQESFSGNLTGQDDLHDVHEEEEHWEKQYQYSQMNLVTEEIDGTLKTTYRYRPGTNLLTEKVIWDGDQRICTETFDYDENAALCLTTFDDGIERRQQRIYACPNEPGYGLPEWIEELCDLGGNWVLLSKMHLHYDDHCRIIQRDVYDRAGDLAYSLHYIYDEVGNLIQATDPLGQITSYDYDLHGNCLEERLPSGLALHHTYDHSNRPIRTIAEGPSGERREVYLNYDLCSRCTSATDPFGHEVTFQRNALGEIEESYSPALRTGKNLWEKPTLRYTRDCIGNCLKQMNALGAHVEHKYTSRGDLCYTLLPDQTEERREYSLQGHLIREVSSTGAVTEYKRDALGRPITVTVYDSAGQLCKQAHNTYVGMHLVSSVDPVGLETHYEYASDGALIEKCCGNELTRWTYDTLGRISSEISYASKDECLRTFWEYDLLGRVIEERREKSDVKRYVYDAAGRITRILTSDSEESIIYNCFGEPTRLIDAEGHLTVIEYEELVPFEGQLLRIRRTTDPLGNIEEAILDGEGRPVHVERRNSFGIALQSYDLFYDLAGRKIREEHDKNYTIIWEYDLAGRIIAEGPCDRVTRYRYHPSGQLSTMIKPDGSELHYNYDDLGRLQAYGEYRYTYDQCGRLLSVIGPEGRASYEYSKEGYLLRETLANGLTMRFEYDRLGRLKELILPDETAIYYAYQGWQLHSVQRDPEGNCFWHTYRDYDLRGHALRNDLPFNLDDTHKIYDAQGRCTQIRHPEFCESIKQYDRNGNPLVIEGRDPQGDFCSTYAYDGLNQITSEGEITYQYDSLQNRLPYDPNDYDAAGRMTAGGRYTYDEFDRLTRVETSDRAVTFTYDSDHRRMSKTTYVCEEGNWIEHSSLRFLYAGPQEIGAVDASGKITELYIPGAGRTAVALELDGKAYIPLHDQRGSIRVLLDADGTVESYRYSAFGESSDISSCGNPYRFLSKRLDEETGLILFGRRYYDPAHGRWLTPDPIRSTHNPYAFVSNQPMVKHDQWGLYEESFLFPGAWSEQPFKYSPPAPGGVPPSNSSPPPQQRGPPLNLSTRSPVPPSYYGLPPPPTKTAPKRSFPSRTLGTHSPGSTAYDPLAALANVRNAILSLFELKPTCYSVGTVDLPNFVQSGWINGINNDIAAALGSGNYISDLLGGYKMEGVHNPTWGADVGALTAIQAGLEYTVPPSGHCLIANWIRHYIETEGRGTYVQFCHSFGSTVVRNSLKIVSEHIQQMVYVIAIAPHCFISEELCRDVIHLVSLRDPIRHADVRGRMKAESDGTILYLRPPSNSWLDHEAQSLTFRKALAKHGRKFIGINNEF